jgi:Uma2 family endonuclease
MSAVLTPPAVKLLTADEFAQDFADRRFELVRGIPVETPMPNMRHGLICSTVNRLMGNFVADQGLGRVMSNDSFVKVERDPDTLRGADVLFVSYERLPKGPVPDGVLDVIPELVVEVVSPSDLWTELLGKAEEYLAAGVNVVVILDPKTETASVYRPGVNQHVFRRADALSVPDVLPGFSVPVAKLFE